MTGLYQRPYPLFSGDYPLNDAENTLTSAFASYQSDDASTGFTSFNFHQKYPDMVPEIASDCQLAWTWDSLFSTFTPLPTYAPARDFTNESPFSPDFGIWPSNCYTTNNADAFLQPPPPLWNTQPEFVHGSSSSLPWQEVHVSTTAVTPSSLNVGSYTLGDALGHGFLDQASGATSPYAQQDWRIENACQMSALAPPATSEDVTSIDGLKSKPIKRARARAAKQETVPKHKDVIVLGYQPIDRTKPILLKVEGKKVDTGIPSEVVYSELGQEQGILGKCSLRCGWEGCGILIELSGKSTTHHFDYQHKARRHLHGHAKKSPVVSGRRKCLWSNCDHTCPVDDKQSLFRHLKSHTKAWNVYCAICSNFKTRVCGKKIC